jgi:aspartate/methionine/tyrosine aminotransferase
MEMSGIDQGPMAAALARRVRSWGVAPSPEAQLGHSGFEGILDLSADYGPGTLPRTVIAAVVLSLDEGETHYTTRSGLPALAQAVACKLQGEQGFTVDPATEVVISCGGQEAVFIGLQVLAEAGADVLVPALRPAYIDEAIRLAGGAIVPVPVLAEDGFVMKASRIRDCLSAKSRVLLLRNPSDPTGAVIPAGEMARIAELAQEHDLTIIADESLDESLDGDVRHRSIVSFSEVAERAIIVGSFSRLHALASWRAGYFAGVQSLVTPLRNLRQAMTICTSAMSQYAALEAITGPQDWLLRRRAEMDAKREYVLGALDGMGLPHSQPVATPYLFVDARAVGFASDEFSTWLLARAGVMTMPGSRYGTQGDGYVRLSLWPTFSELEEAMRRIRRTLERNGGGAQ